MGAFIHAGEIAVVAERGDHDQEQHREDQIDFQHAVDLFPVAVQERGDHQFAHLQARHHDHHRCGGTDKQQAESLHGKVGRYAHDEKSGGHAGELERANVAGAHHVRPGAQVNEVAVLEIGDRFALGNLVEQVRFEF